MAEVLRNRLRELIEEKPSALGTFITLGDPVAEPRDPIERVRRFAIHEGVWSADREAAALDEIRSEIETAQRQVEELPRPGAAAIFEHVYETLPPRLQQQRAEALDDARPI